MTVAAATVTTFYCFIKKSLSWMVMSSHPTNLQRVWREKTAGIDKTKQSEKNNIFKIMINVSFSVASILRKLRALNSNAYRRVTCVFFCPAPSHLDRSDPQTKTRPLFTMFPPQEKQYLPSDQPQRPRRLSPRTKLPVNMSSRTTKRPQPPPPCDAAHLSRNLLQDLFSF